jgi:hypothetical protein
MSNVCPKGHFSSDPDFCSECGARMASTPQAAPETTAAPAADRCPDCGTPRPAGARFCEVCRFDFQAQVSFSGLAAAAAPVPAAVPAATPPASASAAIVPPPAPVAAEARAIRLLLRIVVDASLYKDPDPAEPCPEGAPEKIFHLDLAENTLGRQYEGKGVHPEIVIGDPGISRRHVKFVRTAAGGFAVLELGSINGTTLNGAELEPGVLTPVAAGDQLTLGMWTRIHVEAR